MFLVLSSSNSVPSSIKCFAITSFKYILLFFFSVKLLLMSSLSLSWLSSSESKSLASFCLRVGSQFLTLINALKNSRSFLNFLLSYSSSSGEDVSDSELSDSESSIRFPSLFAITQKREGTVADMWKTQITSGNIHTGRHLTDREIEDLACLNEDPEVVIPNYSLDMWRWNLERQKPFHQNLIIMFFFKRRFCLQGPIPFDWERTSSQKGLVFQFRTEP